MSSFRIDKQYVTFETAEMWAVRAIGQLPGNAGADAGQLEKATIQRDILEKTWKEVGDKVRSITEGAKSDAESILSKARQTATDIIKEAEDNAVDIMEAARIEGYEQGKRDAEVSVEARKSAEAKELQKLTDSMEANYSKLLDSMSCDITSLVIEISKKIIGITLKETNQIFLNLVSGAIDQLKQAGYIMIHVCPEDYARYFEEETEEKLFDRTNAKITVIEEETYSSGDLVVESEVEVLDLSVFKQLGKIEKAFSNERNQ